MASRCNRCGRCCSYVTVHMPVPSSKRDYSNFFWYLLHDGVNVFIDDDGDWFIEFKARCSALDGDACAIHSRRPIVCREHTPADCEFGEAEGVYEHSFSTPEELERYLESEGIEFRYKRGGF